MAGSTVRPHAGTMTALPARRLLGIGVFATAAAVGAGFAAGAPTWFMLRPAAGEDTGFESLGAALGAIFFGLIAGGIAFVAAVVVSVRRAAPAGERLRPAIAILIAPLVLWLALAVGSAPQLPGRYAVIHVVPMAALGAVALLVLGTVAGRPRTATTTRIVVGSVAVAIAFMVVAAALYPTAERAELRRHYERSGARLALIDGSTLEAPFPGWELRYVSHPRFSNHVQVTWMAPASESVSVEFTPEGWEVTAYRGGRRDAATEMAVRSRLRPVSVDAFIEAAARHQS